MPALSSSDILTSSPVIPVIKIEHIEHALPLAEALIKGGIRVLEITLRTQAALNAIELIAKNYPDAIVGAGTVINGEQLKQASDHGAQFIISPGITTKLLASHNEIDLPLIPGIATASELILGMDAGLRHFKLFPAVVAGGTNALKAFHGPFPSAHFCPTGGITESNFLSFLQLPNVSCVGGSWIVPDNSIQTKDWQNITDLCQRAVTLANQI